jgi:hypothetical protein
MMKVRATMKHQMKSTGDHPVMMMMTMMMTMMMMLVNY